MKIQKTIAALAAVLLTFSCAKQYPAGEVEGHRTVTLQAEMGGSGKAAVNQEGVTSWSAEDEIAVYTTSNVIKPFSCVSVDGGTALFEGKLADDEQPHKVAVYPKNAFVSISGEDMKVKYPTSYSYADGYLPCPMAAIVDEDNTLQFKHLGALLSITCEQIPAGAAKFFVAAYHCRMTGDFTVALADGMAARAEESETNSKVTVTFDNDGTAKTFNIPVPAGTYECIYAAFEDENGKKIKEWEVLTDTTIERGDMFVRSMPSSMLRVATYNISFSYNESSHYWSTERKANALAAMPSRHIDLMGSQENTTGQVQDVLSVMPGYSVIGRCNHGSALNVIGYNSSSYEADAIYLRNSRLTVLESGTFWYSNTPDVPSRESSSYNMRCCNWAKMMLDGVKVFYIFNTHLQVDSNTDDKYRAKRVEQAAMVMDRINALGDEYPVIVTGDMNPSVTPVPGEEAIDYFVRNGLRETRSLLKAPHGPSGSLHYYNTSNPTRRTDFIFVNDKVNVHSLWIDNSSSGDGCWESDHFPVIVDLSFN